MSDKPRLVVDIVSDTVCPWCYVGKRSFDRAKLALSMEYELIVRFRPYQLNPDTPAGGADRMAYYDRKFPDKERRAEMQAALEESARGVGLVLDTGLPKILPNTLDSHRVLRWSHYEGLQEAAKEKIMAAYWGRGQDIGDPDVLAAAAAAAGMDKEEVRDRLATDEDMEDVQAEAAGFRQGGVTGVPTFIVNERSGFAGAHDPETLARGVRQCAEEAPLPAGEGVG
ncbi:MAG: DsbA family oxidoreductase [Pseudomonadota bacterium]